LAARAAGVPAVLNTVHGLYATPDVSTVGGGGRVVCGLERLASSCSGAELVQNPEGVAALARIGVPASKLTVLGNGVEFSRFHPDDTERAAVRAELGIGEGG